MTLATLRLPYRIFKRSHIGFLRIRALMFSVCRNLVKNVFHDPKNPRMQNMSEYILRHTVIAVQCYNRNLNIICFILQDCLLSQSNCKIRSQKQNIQQKSQSPPYLSRDLQHTSCVSHSKVQSRTSYFFSL